MGITVTRDSWLMYLAFAAVVVTYLATADKTPNLWTFKEAMQFASVIIAWWIGKLQTSRLPGQNDAEVKKARKEGDIIV